MAGDGPSRPTSGVCNVRLPLLCILFLVFLLFLVFCFALFRVFLFLLPFALFLGSSIM